MEHDHSQYTPTPQQQAQAVDLVLQLGLQGLHDFQDRRDPRVGQFLRQHQAEALQQAGATLRGTNRMPSEVESYRKRGPMPYRGYMHPDAYAKLCREIGAGTAARRAPDLFSNLVLRDFNNHTLQFNQPDLRDVHVDTAMTNVAIEYRNTAYIADQVFPRVQVVHKSDVYFIFDKGDGTSKAYFRDEADIRALSTEAVEVGFDMTTDSYAVKERAAQMPLDDRIRQNADSAVQVDARWTGFVADKIDLSMEGVVATLVNTAGNWTNNVTLNNGSAPFQWSDYANSNPFDDWKTARLKVSQQIGRPVNTAAMSIDVFETLAIHPDMIDRIKYTGTADKPAMVTPGMLAALLRVEKLLIGSAVRETANEGAASSLARTWGKFAWMGYVSDGPALNEPSAGYIFSTGRIIDRYRKEWITSDLIRGREEYDARKTWADAGYLFTTAIA